MTKQRSRALAAIAALAFLDSPSAEGQVVIGRGQGVVVAAPGVTVHVPPVRGFALRRRTLTIAPVDAAAAPYWAPRTWGLRAASSQSRAEAPRRLTAAELASIEDHELLHALRSSAERLQDDLGRFTSAASWRSYLRLPPDAAPPARAGRVDVRYRSLLETLERFETAATNPAFEQINGLPSFEATHAAVSEAVNRFAPAATYDYAGDATPIPADLPSPEQLPAPAPTLVPPRNSP